MLDDILQMVKEHIASNPELAAAIPADKMDAIHNEIATHISNNMPAQAASGSGGLLGGLMGKLESEIAGGGPVASAIEGGLVSSLTSKFGLPPSVTGAIAGALPGLLQKVANKA